MHQTDILVIGAGVAGLTFAIKTAQERPDIHILVITKSKIDETNTSYAQGGIAAVWNHQVDDYAKHIADTLDAGDDLCNEQVVEIVVKEGPERVKELIRMGAKFDKHKGKFDLGKEGGHSENRILHYKDITGWEIQRTLIDKAKSYSNIEIREHIYAIDLLSQHHLGYVVTRVTPDITCYGAYILNRETNAIETITAKVTVVASGGAGQVYRNTTNPTIATGDGIAMAYRAKCRLENMEFVQFHPTALYNPAGENPDFLVSEAVRGFGAILKTSDGKPFMQKYDERESLAPRDIVARAIDNEMKIRGDDFVSLDCRHLEKEAFTTHFPTIYDKCMSLGIDAMKDMIPVVPACHYMCGGIKVNTWGRSSVQHLYAIGECTSTGLHGANRLASNSLLEGLVFAHRAAHDVIQHIDKVVPQNNIPDWDAEGTSEPKEMVLITQSWKELKEIMSSYVGIVRNNVRLRRANSRLHLLYRETEALYQDTILSPQLFELRNLITIGYLITKSAEMRKESRGLHYTTDYPKKLAFLDVTIL
ncbi:MAG: L-aspartate oxidase [Saprospiraceae bacterium]|nr:L-aspartate oxidase [Saprospiraceae bacterium]